MQGFVSIDAFLHDDFAHFQAFFDFRHFVAVFAVQAAYFVGRFHAHHAHAVSARIGFDDDEGLVGNAFFIVFGLYFRQHPLHRVGQSVFTFALLEIQAGNLFEIRIDLPFVHTDQGGKFSGHVVVGGKVGGFSPCRPAAVQGRQHGLADVFENIGYACRQVVVEQYQAGREAVRQMHAPAGALQRFECDRVAQGGFQFHRFGNFGVDTAQPYFETRVAQDIRQGINVLQVEGVAGMVFRHDQHRFGLRAGTLHRVERGMGGQLDEIRIQVVETAGEQIHVDGSHFVARVADVHRAVKRGLVLLPFAAEPRLYFGLVR